MTRKASWYAKLSGGAGQPVNSMTARLIGARGRPALDRMRGDAERLRALAKKEQEPAALEQLLAQIARIEQQIRAYGEPKTSAAAEAKARRALERAKWERASRRGR